MLYIRTSKQNFTIFLEPGFHVLLEWGWNVNDSWSQRLGGGGPINVCEMVSYDTWKTVKTKEKIQNTNMMRC